MTIEDFHKEVFCFSGKMQMPRGEMQAAVEHRDGEWCPNVTSECTCLVYGERPGAKYRKAQELGLKLISCTEFWPILEAIPRNDGGKLFDLYVPKSRRGIVATEVPTVETPQCDVSTTDGAAYGEAEKSQSPDNVGTGRVASDNAPYGDGEKSQSEDNVGTQCIASDKEMRNKDVPQPKKKTGGEFLKAWMEKPVNPIFGWTWLQRVHVLLTVAACYALALAVPVGLCLLTKWLCS